MIDANFLTTDTSSNFEPFSIYNDTLSGISYDEWLAIKYEPDDDIIHEIKIGRE